MNDQDDFSEEQLLTWATEEAAAELVRYGGRVFDNRIIQLLQGVTDLNDDLWHMRSAGCIQERVNNIKDALKSFDK